LIDGSDVGISIGAVRGFAGGFAVGVRGARSGVAVFADGDTDGFTQMSGEGFTGLSLTIPAVAVAYTAAKIIVA